MSSIKKLDELHVDKTGNVGAILSGYIDDYMNASEIKTINKKIELLNTKLNNLDIFKYKISNRIKIRNLIVKVLSEDSDIFMDIAIELLSISEENFENIVESFLKLTKNDIDTLYYNLWKKQGNDKFDILYLKDEISNNYEFRPDLIMSYEYRVNKEIMENHIDSLIIGEHLILMPNLESSNIFNVFEKLAFNNFIKISKYIPNKNQDSFPTYLCFNFTYLGIHICKIMKKIEEIKKRSINNE